MKKISLLFLFLLSLSLFAQKNILNATKTKQEVLDTLFANTREIQFRFHAASKEQINTILTQLISIDRVNQNLDVIAYANRTQFRDFLELGIPYTLMGGAKATVSMASTVAQMSSWDKYPTYPVYLQMMAQFQANYPSLCHIDTILAATAGGHMILVAKISANVNQTLGKPQFLYTSSIHGDEVTGYALMLRLMDYLLTNYNTNPKVTNLVNNVEIWICPDANPDGTYASDNNLIGDSPYSNRANTAGFDLNRNYPDPRVGNPTSPYGPIQTETNAFMNFANAHNFTMGANFHGGAEVVNYPFDTWTSAQKTHADDAWFQYVSKMYVDTARVNLGTYMTSVNSAGFTEGADWYVITGGRQDYMNYYKLCREVTIEISNVKLLPGTSLNNYWNYNYKSFLNFAEQCSFGISGIVTDSLTGQPLRAMVFVNSHDRDSSHVYSILPNGDYHRPIIAGTYSLTFSAPCYKSKTINNVVVTNNNLSQLNVQLAPGMTSNFIADTATANCTGNVVFTNFSTGAAGYLWDFGDGTTSNLANPSHTYSQNGQFSIKLKVSGSCGSDSTLKTDFVGIHMSPAPSGTNDSVCISGSANLLASGNGVLNWYNLPSGGNTLDTGVVFHTPVISSSTTYYVESQIAPPSQHLGKADTSGTHAYLNANQALIFNCYTPVKLLSVKVYAQSAGVRTIELRDSNGTVMQTINVNLPAGESRATLNFNLPLANKLQLGASGTSINMYRNSAGVAFPYTINNVLSIYTTTASSNPTLYYYYFYDWEVVGANCKSQRAAVQAVVKQIPTASYSSACNILTVSFTNTSSANANSYFWRFGDGNTSTNVNPTHTYATSGAYNVTLIATNSCGVDSITQMINTGGFAPQIDFYASDTLIHTGDTIHFIDLSQNAPTTWNWTFNGAIPSTSVAQFPISIKYPVAGYYSVSLQAGNNYGANNLAKNLYIHVVDTSVGIQESGAGEEVIIIPNPVTGNRFILQLQSAGIYEEIALYNTLSQKVWEATKESRLYANQIEVSCKDFQYGIYTLLCKARHSMVKKKILMVR